ncbi:hypothetical protein [Caryophanon latum]|uniref:CRISPR system ring nuclease SSO1393-like domain-containing protein n=1 Tax=Caryophanon latum TaxID=33977 RepID=A0A1C0YV35_9BACL|nr:hypothetical protein [Caryophanon latum]OCS91023.1 hypothetical protein A6K76_09770 [Caryophanon latum]
MYNRVVMTCGISLLSPANVFNHATAQKLTSSFNEVYCDEQSQQQQITQYVEYVRQHLHHIEDSEKVSAEYSLISALLKRKKLHNSAHITLIATNTIGGVACSAALCEIINKKFGMTVKRQIVQMTVSNQQQFQEQQAKYMHVLANALSEGEPRSTCFAPLGGYKVMTSLGYIVGSFLHYPTTYLHEEQQFLIEVPPVPLDIDEAFVKGNMDLLRRCQREFIPFEELTAQEQALVEQHTAIFTIDEEHVTLTVFGAFLFEREKYKQIFQTHYYLSEQVRNEMAKNKAFVEQELERLVMNLKLRAGAYESHEREIKGLKSKPVYKLAKAAYGQSVFRLTYLYDEEKDELQANYLWLDHDLYERDIAKGVGLMKEEKNMQQYVIGG